MSKPSKEELLDLYITTIKSIKLLGKQYNVGERTINRWFKEYKIKPIRSVERKYYHLRQVPLTQKQKEFVIGSLLGDGHISKGKLKRFAVCHGEKQLDYLKYKKDLLSNFITTDIHKTIQKTRNSTLYSITTIGHKDFEFFHNLFYKDKKIIKEELINLITPYSIAIWFMDDGNTRKYNMKLCTESFTKEENEVLTKIFDKFDIICNVYKYNNREKKYYYLTFNKENSIKLSKLIKPYIIPSMGYKLSLLND